MTCYIYICYCCSHCLKANPNFAGSSGKVHSCGVAQAQVIDGVALLTACDCHTAHALPCPQLWRMTNPRVHGQDYQLSSHVTLSIRILNKYFMRDRRRILVMFWFLSNRWEACASLLSLLWLIDTESHTQQKRSHCKSDYTTQRHKICYVKSLNCQYQHMHNFNVTG